MKRAILSITPFFSGILCLDWKPYALALAGFLLGVLADRLNSHYGGMVGAALILIGWWLILGGLLMAKRNDLPLWKIAQTKDKKG